MTILFMALAALGLLGSFALTVWLVGIGFMAAIFDGYTGSNDFGKVFWAFLGALMADGILIWALVALAS